MNKHMTKAFAYFAGTSSFHQREAVRQSMNFVANIGSFKCNVIVPVPFCRYISTSNSTSSPLNGLSSEYCIEMLFHLNDMFSHAV